MTFIILVQFGQINDIRRSRSGAHDNATMWKIVPKEAVPCLVSHYAGRPVVFVRLWMPPKFPACLGVSSVGHFKVCHISFLFPRGWWQCWTQCLKAGSALASAGPDWKYFCGAPLTGVCRNISGRRQVILIEIVDVKEGSWKGREHDPQFYPSSRVFNG